MRPNLLFTTPLLACFLLTGCGGSGSSGASPGTGQPTQPAVIYPDFADVTLSGGAATDTDISNSGHGFSQPMPNLDQQQLALHMAGDANFEQSFTTTPNDSHPELDGLGPVFNNQNCNACHQRDGRPSTLQSNDGRPLLLGSNAGIFLRMSLDDGLCENPSPTNDFCRNTPVPGFGTQLFHRGVLKAREDWQDNPFGGQAEVSIRYQSSHFTYPDGTVVELNKPLFSIDNAYDSPNDPAASNLTQAEVRFSARNGMPVFGLGLLEAIDEQDILALADPQDADNDGISGRPNWVYDQVKARLGDPLPVSLGRFGWKANTPSVRVQSLGALRGDMGITNELFDQESIDGTALHQSYLSRTNYSDTGSDENGGTEADDDFSESVVFYAETLAVPARRNVSDTNVREGARLFDQVGCTGCHHPGFVTSSSADLTIGGRPAIDALKGQQIWPFTDMLLHDMGEGLADNRRDSVANGQEWKTRPLWGVGLTQTVNPAAGFLHDGRAATLEQAILWHGGEGKQSRDSFAELSAAQRQQLLAFLRSL